MAINARTFEILYIVRQRAMLDLPTKLEDFSEFIAARRKDAPDIYYRAYIAPSALVPLLHRMTTGEGLLTFGGHSQDCEYEFTPRGSQMADLLVDLDACTTRFLENYKEEICLAVLQQRQRLGQGPVNPREVAAIANISLDSARRGLEALASGNRGVVEDRSERTPTYAIEAATPVEEDEDEGGVTEADIEAAARIPLDENEDPIRAALRDLENEDDAWATAGPPPPAADEDEELELPLALGQILADDGPDEEPPPKWSGDPFAFAPQGVEYEEHEEDRAEEALRQLDKMPEDDYCWENVPAETREGIIIRAKAAGMPLNKFLFLLNQLHEAQVRAALFGEMPDPLF